MICQSMIMIETFLNIEPVALITFVLAGLLLNITPGADFLYVTVSGINGGPKVGRAAAVGINLGVVVHIIAAALGVSALLIAHPVAYEFIRYFGAAYLVFIAWKAWTDTGELAEGTAAISPKDAIKRGFLTNVLNPKTALFIFAFIPQFTNPSVGPIWHQILIFGAIFTINGFLFVLALGTIAGHLAPILKRHVQTLNKITAIMFGGLAAKLVLD